MPSSGDHRRVMEVLHAHVEAIEVEVWYSAGLAVVSDDETIRLNHYLSTHHTLRVHELEEELDGKISINHWSTDHCQQSKVYSHGRLVGF